ncbi:unnamed protein product [Closterium sp. NIES-64]|nr:unnamed protein product [Closterium sp. NIES-64]
MANGVPSASYERDLRESYLAWFKHASCAGGRGRGGTGRSKAGSGVGGGRERGGTGEGAGRDGGGSGEGRGRERGGRGEEWGGRGEGAGREGGRERGGRGEKAGEGGRHHVRPALGAACADFCAVRAETVGGEKALLERSGR